MSFVHLHVHSQYSFLDGLARPAALLARAKELGMPAVALTDHMGLYGAVEFFRCGRELGVKPILGCELSFCREQDRQSGRQSGREHHLVVLVRDAFGYENLCRMLSAAHLESTSSPPRVDWPTLAGHARGLIALSGCRRGEIPALLLSGAYRRAKEAARQYRDLFGPDGFYLELQDHGLPEEKRVNRLLVELAEYLSIPLVATNNVHYLEPADGEVHRLTTAVRNYRAPEQLFPGLPNSEFYLKTPAQMAGLLFARLPRALENTLKIAGECNLELPQTAFPAYPVPAGRTPDSFLRTLCLRSLDKCYPRRGPEIPARLEQELAVIAARGFASYFLFVWDLVSFARCRGISVGPGRGSAAGSLVAYLLGITGVDPIKHNLYFERFLNPSRPDPPDIDLDVCQRRRGELIEYLRRRYGPEKVAQIATFSTLGLRGAVREAGRALNFPRALLDGLARHLPAFSGPGGLDEALAKLPEISRLAGKEPVKTLFAGARLLEGLIHHPSVHAAGVVVSGRELASLIPLKRGGTGEVVTQYDQESLAFLGLPKIDLLGLRNLTIIDDTMKLVQAGEGRKLSLASIPLDDPATYRLLSKGNTLGCFQLESAGMRRLLKRLKPKCFDDLIAVLSLYRPGPWEGGMVETFLRRRRGEEEVSYPHPDLAEILEETRGIVLYQEQIMKIAHRVAGFSLGEADLLRRALGSRNRELVAEYRQKFYRGAVQRGYPAEETEKIFDLLAGFSGYSFNKAHSVSYAHLSYYTAYLKANYTPYYLAALLSTGTGYYGPGVYIQDGLRLGIQFRLPEINRSAHCFTVEGRAVRAGLGIVKGVGPAALTAILESRLKEGPFRSLYDFCLRVKVNKKAVRNLILGGAFNSFGLTRPTMLAALDKIMAAARRSRRHREAGQLSLLGEPAAGETGSAGGTEVSRETGSAGETGFWPAATGFEYGPVLPEYSIEEQLRLEKEIFGFYLTGNPLARERKKLSGKGVLPLIKLASLPAGAFVEIAGQLVSARRQPNIKDEYLVILLLEDETAQAEVVVSPQVYRRFFGEITPGLLSVGGYLSRQNGDFRVFAERVRALSGGKHFLDQFQGQKKTGVS